MGEFLLEGADVLPFLNYLLTNEFDSLQAGSARYSPMCNESGGVVDDLLVYKKSENLFMLVVNASNREKDFSFIGGLLKKQNADVVLRDISDNTGLIALQGPAALSILETLVPEEKIPKKSYTFSDELTVAGRKGLVSRTGYTGEDGFEFYTAWTDTPLVYDAILTAGREFGVLPCGLGARDTLRLEAAMPLYGHEMDESVSPLEAGLGFFVKLQKPGFSGKAAMLASPPKRKRIGLELLDKGIAREHCPVFLSDEKIGEVSSGTLSPFSQKSIAMALVDAEKISSAATDATFKIDVRGRLLSAKAVPLPFYKRIRPSAVVQ
jgi:aminomethyltransferase